MATAAERRTKRNGETAAAANAGVAYVPAAVTAALRHLLENGLIHLGAVEGLGSDVQVTALPPDRIKAGEDERVQLNVFLYEVRPRGLDVLSRYSPDTAAGYRLGTGTPALELSYLLSAYGPQDIQIEVLLGGAMEVLRQHPVLTSDELGEVFTALAAAAEGGRTVLPAVAALARSGLAQRISAVRLSHFFLETEEAMQFWSALQSKLRPSLLYRASVFLAPGASEGTERDDA